MALKRLNSNMVGAGDVSDTEHGYLNSLTSNVQTQLDANSLPAAGASGNVLTSDGTNWASQAAAGGGAWTYINSISTTGAMTFFEFQNQTVAFNTYSTIAIVVHNLQPGTDNTYLKCQFADGNTYHTSGYQYHISNLESGGAGYASNQSNSSDGWVMGRQIGNAANENVSGTYYINNAVGSSATSTGRLSGWGTFATVRYNGELLTGVTAFHDTNDFSNTGFKKIRFELNNTTINFGRITLYGIKHTA